MRARPGGAEPALLAVAAAAAAALHGELPTGPPLAALQDRLFPGCAYLALGVCGPLAAGGGDPLLLLSANLLADTAATGGSGGGVQAAAGVHELRRCLGGAAILAGKPHTCILPAAEASSSGCAWTDVALAARRHHASSLVCLPFQAAAAPPPHAEEPPCGSCSSGTVSSRGSTRAVLLLGAQQQLQQQPAGGSGVLTAQHMQALVQLAAALARRAQQELAQAAEGLGVLAAAQPAAAAAAAELSEEEEEEAAAEEEGDGEGLDALEQHPAEAWQAAAGPAAAAAAAGAAAAAAGTAAAEARSSSSAAPGRCSMPGQRPSSDSLQAAATPRLASDSPAAAGDAPDSSDGSPTAARAARAAAPAAGAADAPAPAAAPAGVQRGGRSLAGRLRYLARLCRAVLEQQLLLPSARRGMHLDWLLRFRETPAAPGGTEEGEEAAVEGSDVAVAAGASWGVARQLRRQQSTLEARFARYHSRLMADKLDAAGALLLLAILVLLAKDPSTSVHMDQPLFAGVALVLKLPLAALLPGAPNAWYVRHREAVLQAFFIVALLFQWAHSNLIDATVSRMSQARYINAGYAWLTVDGLLLQMRFCRQLPTLLACFLLSLEPIRLTCARFHPHLDPLHCAVVAFVRGLLHTLIPLAIIWLLELRVRRNWLLREQRQAAAAVAPERPDEQRRQQPQ